MQVVHEFSNAKGPLLLSSYSLGVGQAQQAAVDQLGGVSNLIVSSTGKWAAVVKGSHVHAFDLEAMSYHGRFPALQVGLANNLLPHLMHNLYVWGILYTCVALCVTNYMHTLCGSFQSFLGESHIVCK